MVPSGERAVLIRNPILFDVNRDVDLMHFFCNHIWVVSCALWWTFIAQSFHTKNNKLPCTILISSSWKSCKFEFYTTECFKLIVVLLIIESILNRIFLMECFELIVVFITDCGIEVDINMASINVENVSLGNLTNNAWH